MFHSCFLPRVVIASTPVVCRACWSLLHPWIVRRVGVHGRTAVIDGFGAQFVVPGFAAVDGARPVLGAVLRQPRRGIEVPNDEELDPVVRGIRCSLAQGTEQSWIKVGYTRNLVLKDRRAVGMAPSASPSAPRCSLQRTSMGDAAVENEDASNR